MPPGGQHAECARPGRGGFLRDPKRRCGSPEHGPNRRPECTDSRPGQTCGSARGNGGEKPQPGLLRGPERDYAPGEPSPPVCNCGAKEPEPRVRALSSETCLAHRGALNQRGRGLSVSFWDWEREAWFLKFLRVGLYFLGLYCPYKVFQQLVFPFPTRSIPSPVLPSPVTYLCKRSSLRHGADVGSFLLPCVGVGPGRRAA